MNEAEQPLYVSHRKIYPQSVTGFFRTLKWRVSWLLLGIYFVTPWLRWERGPDSPDQAVLLDIDGRRAYFFSLEIWPQEIYYLTGLLIFGAVALFTATALAGRVWCGFTCPQTVWIDLFMWVGHVIEGDRNKRIKLGKAPWSLEKVAKKVLKHSIWLAISLFTALTFVLYFVNAPAGVADILSGRSGQWVNTTVLVLTASTYIFAGWLREQVCIYMCPWMNFQVSMIDEESLVVTYEEWRGEPRGNAKAGQSFEERGHCVDCNKCVLVCPTGIDIRKGHQAACIGCALCIDACDSVMDKFNLPRGLIRYDSECNLVARSKGQPTKIRLLRPRIIAYGAILVLIVGFMVFNLAARNTLEINIQADRAPLFVRLSDGGIRNGYTFKILNMEHRVRNFTLGAHGIKGATVRVIGHGAGEADSVDLTVGADRVGTFRVFITAGRGGLTAKATPVTFQLKDKESGQVFSHDSRVRGPGR